MVTLAEAKTHCRVDGGEEDALMQGYLDAATAHLASIDVDMTADPLPRPLHHAVLMMVGHFYENRAASSADDTRTTPLGVDRLIAPFKGISL